MNLQRLASWIDRFQLWISIHAAYDGLTISVLDLHDNSTALVTRVKEALALLERYDARCYRRLKRDCQRIWLKVLVGAIGEYKHSLRTIALDQRFLASSATPTSYISATLVHEATHARLNAWGVGYTEADRARVERLCFQQELAFAQLLPDSESLVAMVRRMQALPATTWDNDTLQATAIRRAPAAFNYVGAPNWVARLVVCSAQFSRWLRRKRAA
jgi:hypothetical protein